MKPEVDQTRSNESWLLESTRANLAILIQENKLKQRWSFWKGWGGGPIHQIEVRLALRFFRRPYWIRASTIVNYKYFWKGWSWRKKTETRPNITKKDQEKIQKDQKKAKKRPKPDQAWLEDTETEPKTALPRYCYCDFSILGSHLNKFHHEYKMNEKRSRR